MKKKSLILMLMLVLAMSLVGCGKKNGNGNENPPNNENELGNNGSDEEDKEDIEKPGDNNEDGEQEGQENTENELPPTGEVTAEIDQAVQDKLNAIKEAVIAAYGKDNIPATMQMEESTLKEAYGIDPAWYDGVVTEVAMMSTHVDTFIAIHPKEGNADKIKEALEKYRDFLINESFQYPMNMPKVNATEVLEHDGNYYLIILGNAEFVEDEAKMLELYKEQNQIAVKAIKEFK